MGRYTDDSLNSLSNEIKMLEQRISSNNEKINKLIDSLLNTSLMDLKNMEPIYELHNLQVKVDTDENRLSYLMDPRNSRCAYANCSIVGSYLGITRITGDIR